MSVSAAKQLADMIVQAVEEIEADTAKRLPGAKTTDINQPVIAPEDGLEVTPQRRKAIRNLQAAAHQLLATLMPAGMYLQDILASSLQTPAIEIALRAGIADLIHSIDPDSSKGGAHLEVLAEKAGMDPRKLRHILRFLALRNIFCELTPNHWGNTRLSVTLRTDSLNSQCNAIGHFRDEIALPAIIELPNVLLDKESGAAFSQEYRQSAFSKYYKTDMDFFDFLSKSEGGYRSERFGKAMIELSRAAGDEATHYNSFGWQKLGSKGTLIDVGGGIGAAAYAISRYLPGWTVVVQDRAEVIKQGKENYQSIKSTAKLEFEEADFFKDQPSHRIGTVDAYFLRHILHDWPSKECVQLLTHLRKAAKPTTRLLICEIQLEAPLVDSKSSILSNDGMASSNSHKMNLSMLTLFNSEERSEEEFSQIFKAGGWMLKSTTPLAVIPDRVIFEGVPDPNWK